MNKCKLCEHNEANQTGSHIIPHFLIKSMVNEGGSKKRDKEVSFGINSIDADVFFGRSVTIDKIEETMGKPLTDDEIEGQSNHFTIDNMLCDSCEKKLAIVESYYSLNSENGKVDAKVSTIFWYSILWRISASKCSGLTMKNKDEKKIRKLLNSTLTLNIKTVKENSISNTSLFDSIAYKLLKVEELDEEDGLLFMAHPTLFTPYSLIINNFTIFFYTRLSYLKNISQNFFGFEKLYTKNSPVISESMFEECHIVDRQVFFKCVKKFADFKVKDFGDKLKIFINSTFRNLTGKNASPQLVQNSIHEIIYGESTMGERYGQIRMHRIIAKHIILEQQINFR